MRHTTLAALGLFLLSVAAVEPAMSQTPSLTGTWKLNTKESDDAREKLKQATASTMKMSDGMSSGRGTVRTGAGRVDGESGGGREERSAGSLPGPDFGRVMRPAAQIRVEQNDTVVIINDDKGLPLIFYTDGRKVEEPMAGAEPKQTVAQWKDGKLTVERKMGGTGSIKEVYILHAEKKRLTVEAKLTSPTLGKTVEVKRVYDAGS